MIESYIFFVTSRASGHTLELSYQSFIKWYDNVWNKNNLMKDYLIAGSL